MDTRAHDLIQAGDRLFAKRGSLTSLWQDIGDSFYPERADFTASRSLGDDFAGHLMTSYPILARRDLGNSFSAMLRPRGQQWFHIRAAREEREDTAARQWLESRSAVMRRAMYDRSSNFVRATKEGDHDFAAFGQAALSVETNRAGDALLYRCWHLRDVAWCENAEGKIDTVHRRWTPTARDLHRLFRDKAAAQIKETVEQNPYREVNCRHIVVPSDEYEPPAGGRKWKTPFVSVYLDVDNEHVMEEVGVYTPVYVIPRWQTVSGSQYAYSPATVAALPDARLIQAMTRVLLEAGEKATNPPMLAVQEAIRSDVQIFAGGITWVDAEYDERLGEVLRPLTQDKSGIPVGLEMQQDVREMIAAAFYLNKLGLPPPDREMTAYEVGQRMSEWIREAVPLFEPLESDYNGALCEATFDLLLRHGAFGPPDDMPESLSGANVEFRFESPLQAAEGRQKGQRFLEVRDMLLAASEVDPGTAAHLDIQAAFRDAVQGIGAPAEWMRDEKAAAETLAARQKAAQAQEALAAAGQGAAVAEQAGKAGQALQAAGAI
ncbi:MAG TPA: portal protein [Paracoccaceae bacterium]|nr:portal protein [Paracoccaceae bacterium]